MELELPYRNRAEAGRLLAQKLAPYKSKPNVLVLGLTRGGVPVAAEVAAALQAPLDVVVVRKIGVPFDSELAMGAIAGDNTLVLDSELVRSLGLAGEDVEAAVARERAEVERREKVYRAGRSQLDLTRHTAILVDDGLATGATMLAAVAFARKRMANRIVMAVPVSSVEAREKLRQEVDECISLATPDPFWAVGEWYWNFLPVEDGEVVKLLKENVRRVHVAAPAA